MILQGIRFLFQYIIHSFKKYPDAQSYYDSIKGDILPTMPGFNVKNAGYWMNVGYWKGAENYPEACENLARLLAEKGEFKEGLHLLDVGFGLGQQDFFWKENFKLSHITGIDITPLHVETARARAVEMGRDSGIRFLLGSAVKLHFAADSFDRVSALDCAYHFSTRENFLKEAYRVLKPGGILAVSDMLPRPGEKTDWPWQKMGRKSLFIPEENLYDRNIYKEKLLDIGFKTVEIESIAPYVFTGLLRYFTRRAFNGNLLPKDIAINISEKKFAQSKAYKIWGINFGTSDYVMAKAMKT